MFPGARYVLAAEGTGFTYDGTGLPTGGDLFSLTFDLATLSVALRTVRTLVPTGGAA